MTDPLATLAHYVREAARVEADQGLANRCGLHKNYIHRAIHPNEEHGHDGRHYSPVVQDNLLKLLTGLGLTFAPVDTTVPTVGYVCELIDRMDADPVAKEMAIAMVHKAGTVRREERAA